MSLIARVNTVADLPKVVSLEHSSKTALIVDGRSVTYAELENRSNQIANALVDRGIQPGDRIALLAKDSLESIGLLFGAAKARAVCVNINWRLASQEIDYIVRDAAPRLFFADPDFSQLASRVVESSNPDLQVIMTSALANWTLGGSDSVPGLEYDPEDVVVQIYTSGTTGHPKGVQLPSRSLFAIAKEMDKRNDPWIGWDDTAMSLLFVPTFHIGGLWWLMQGLVRGSTTVLLRSFDPKAILRAIQQYRITKTCMVPSMLQVLLAEPGCSDTDFSSLETIVYGGSPISAAVLERAINVFQCHFCQIYGMTETGNMAVCLRPEDHVGAGPQSLRAAGRPLPGVTLRILNREGNEVEAGMVGEVAIQSPARMAGYWKLPEATRQTLGDGWVMSGDAGFIDEAGLLHICDRIKDMIISAGENIYPAEIENVIRSHPGVADVAVIGVPDALWGEAVKALIVPQAEAGITPGEIIRHTRAHLAEFKVPKSVEFVGELPRNASGKILKARLRESYWQGQERRVN